jgi:hypothetical protein
MRFTVARGYSFCVTAILDNFGKSLREDGGKMFFNFRERGPEV